MRRKRGLSTSLKELEQAFAKKRTAVIKARKRLDEALSKFPDTDKGLTPVEQSTVGKWANSKLLVQHQGVDKESGL